MENQRFYLISALEIAALVAVSPAVYFNLYLPASALAFLSVGLHRVLEEEITSIGRTDEVKTLTSFIEGIKEIAVVAPLLTVPVVPKTLGIAVLGFYAFQHLFRDSVERKMQKELYPLLQDSYRVILAGAVTGSAFFNQFTLYWGAWSFLSIYLLELLESLRQLRQPF